MEFGYKMEQDSKSKQKVFLFLKFSKLEQIKEKQRPVLRDWKEIMERWREYFQAWLAVEADEE